jgi:hypothetical protein
LSGRNERRSARWISGAEGDLGMRRAVMCARQEAGAAGGMTVCGQSLEVIEAVGRSVGVALLFSVAVKGRVREIRLRVGGTRAERLSDGRAQAPQLTRHAGGAATATGTSSQPSRHCPLTSSCQTSQLDCHPAVSRCMTSPSRCAPARHRHQQPLLPAVQSRPSTGARCFTCSLVLVLVSSIDGLRVQPIAPARSAVSANHYRHSRPLSTLIGLIATLRGPAALRFRPARTCTPCSVEERPRSLAE